MAKAGLTGLDGLSGWGANAPGWVEASFRGGLCDLAWQRGQRARRSSKLGVNPEGTVEGVMDFEPAGGFVAVFAPAFGEDDALGAEGAPVGGLQEVEVGELVERHFGNGSTKNIFMQILLYFVYTSVNIFVC